MVFKNTFKHGFHIQGKKELSRGDKYIEIPAPYIVKIPLLQHIGTPSEPVVKVGDYVKVGQLIAKKVGTISANIHSSVSGKVSKIEYSTATRGNHVKCIFIENDYKNELGYELMNRDYTRLSSEEIIKIVEDAGITGLGGASFPTHIKLNPPTSVQDVIINSAECEPYLTSDDVNMRNFAKDIVIGLKIEMHALNAQNGHILIEDDKPEAIKAIKEAVKDESNIRVVVAKAKYPQGDEKRVIDVTLGKVVPFGKHPFDVGVIVSNATTALSIKKAVINNIPLYERIVTFSGESMKRKANALVKFGTPISKALEFLGGVDKNISRIVIGGPMMGLSKDDMEIPLEKPTNGILALSKKETYYSEQEPCIKCSSCVEVCPVGLQPFLLAELIRNRDIRGAIDNNIMSCIECGLCSYICPSHIPLVEIFKEGKRMVRELRD
ncbi:electron transport complex subunit RsxC [Helcococcus ovis]|uniref:Ion-translocating oxidoreductase complex subunit C n=1 Tax=Helcococcus ovis TaxID=72026 RepID=A0A4R9C4N9_9FIRM|nr:electron transport complex subunit RsxC [Helcococcus ovis]TFF65256.1 electron transport complex subunit RsxC [Helcococcus ovis]TFF66901.1 electron transport complex subunit RsxC [Helcococcus ovis]TFF67466.1 electron transport complex subunit RsxC [Helcococcus ovis]WNZ01760.1 electron transport complex subunit RsxC [Helcococcus ovis]